MIGPHSGDDMAGAFASFRSRDDWTEALHFSKEICSILPFVLAIGKTSWYGQLPNETRMECDRILSRERMVLALLDDELAQAAGLLLVARIPVIVLKGMDVGRRFYPERMLRPMGDVDLLVPAASYRDAWRALLRGGYQQIEPHFKHSFRSSLARGTELPSIDLHYGLIAGEPETVVEAYWKNSVAGEFPGISDGLRVLSKEDCLVYMLRHSAVLHVLESPVWMIDLHYIISAGSLDWHRILSELRRSRAISAAAFVFEILHSNWQTPIPSEVRAELCKNMGMLRRQKLAQRLKLSAWYRPGGRAFLRLALDRFLLRDTVPDAIKFGVARVLRKVIEARNRDQAATFGDRTLRDC